MVMNKIKIKFASYALHDILRALKCSGVDEVTITKEDNDLILVVNTDMLKERVIANEQTISN